MNLLIHLLHGTSTPVKGVLAVAAGYFIFSAGKCVGEFLYFVSL
ncbi:hypothetical protein [Hymenobacter amundsenii]|nr:hypothetical protein [Hymenobacter amundsenii]